MNNVQKVEFVKGKDLVTIEIFDKEPQEIQNPWSGDTCMLEPLAVGVYDYIKGCEMLGKSEQMLDALGWFRRNYPKEYMLLLD